MTDHATDTRAQAAAEARARLIPRRACSCVDACAGGDTTEYCRGLPAPERATGSSAAVPLPCAVCDERVDKRVIEPAESHDGRAWLECPHCGTLIPLHTFHKAGSDD